ncbi:MAG: indolepyruvate oxidoreductase subunit beta [Kiritimatiellia bacterium]|nr:indolepyruvate oxidoreductase subunit beta [Kiritimatiellia bacterium]
MTTNISLVGVGGQGTLLTSDILAKVAMAAGLDVKKSEIHGMAQRGGSVISQVRFGERVCSPIIADGTSDILVSFDKLEALRWKHLVRPQARVLVNDLYLMPITVSTGQKADVEDLDGELVRSFPGLLMVPAQRIAECDMGNSRCMNMVMAGAVSRFLAFPEELWLEVMRGRIPAKLLDLNIRAFAAGRAATRSVVAPFMV